MLVHLVIVALTGCSDSRPQQQQYVGSTLVAEVFDGVADPRALGTPDIALKSLTDYLAVVVQHPQPGDAAKNLAMISLEWGYYADALAFAELAAKQGSDRGVELALLSNYLLGRRLVDLHWGGAMKVPSYVTDFEFLLDNANASVDSVEMHFRRVLTSVGNDAPFLVLALVSHPRFRPDADRLTWFAKETCRFFSFHVAIDCRDLDKESVSQTVDSNRYIFDPVGRFFNFSLVATALSRRFELCGDSASASIWLHRAKVSLGAGRVAGDWRIGWDSHLKVRSLQ